MKMMKLFSNLVQGGKIGYTIIRPFSSTGTLYEKWDLITAICVERKPVIAPKPTDLEVKFKKYLEELEFENSVKSDYEIRHEKELKQMEKLKKGDDIEVHLNQTAQDLIDAATDELAKFQFASRVTEADKKNDLKSLQRKLDKHLVLLTKQKLGNKDFYLLPQGIRQDGETLRQTAERVLKESCGTDLKASFYGNAPSSFYKYKYPKVTKNESVGAKVFIYFARYNQGEFNKKETDYKWLDREELRKTLPTEYEKSVSQMLIDE